MREPFVGFTLENFWEDSEYAANSYTDQDLTPELLGSVEAELGFKIPKSYVALMQTRNGGIPRHCCFPTEHPTSWADDHVAISGIRGVGHTRTYSLCGMLGSAFMQEEWGYPEFGVSICTCPSAGHDLIMLDYRACGPQGEPSVVHVDQEAGFAITPLAPDFETFVRGLVDEAVYDTSELDQALALEAVASGSFTPPLARLLQAPGMGRFGPTLRHICRLVTEEKGGFSLHSDELSHLTYDLLFHLASTTDAFGQKEDFTRLFPTLIVFGDGTFTTGGYGPGFIDDWFDTRWDGQDIRRTEADTLAFREDFTAKLLARLREFE